MFVALIRARPLQEGARPKKKFYALPEPILQRGWWVRVRWERRGIEGSLKGRRLGLGSIIGEEPVVPIMPPHIRRNVKRPCASRVRAGISYKKKKKAYPECTDRVKRRRSGKRTILTTLSGMSVVMNREAAWAVEPFPATVTDVFPSLVVVRTILRVYGTRRFRRRRSVSGIRFP